MSDRLAGVRVIVVNNFPGPTMGGGEVQLLSVCDGLLSEGARLYAILQKGSGLAGPLAERGASVEQLSLAPSRVPGVLAALRCATSGPGPSVLVGTGYFTNLLVRFGRGGPAAAL